MEIPHAVPAVTFYGIVDPFHGLLDVFARQLTPTASRRLADRIRAEGFGVIHDFYLSAAGAASFPTPANSERMMDDAEVVSAAYGVSVDALLRWAADRRDALAVG